MSSGSLPLISRFAALLAALGCWATACVPISSTRPDAPFTIEYGLFDHQIDNPMAIVLAATWLVTLLAGLAWLPGAPRWWPFVALAAVAVQIATAILHALPTGVFWDGMDEFGNPTGGYEEILPATGWWLLVLATALMLLAALVPLVRRRRAPRGR